MKRFGSPAVQARHLHARRHARANALDGTRSISVHPLAWHLHDLPRCVQLPRGLLHDLREFGSVRSVPVQELGRFRFPAFHESDVRKSQLYKRLHARWSASKFGVAT